MEELYINKIKELLSDNCKKIEVVSSTSNIVYRIETDKYGIVYAKVYLNKSSHTDNELKLYDILDNKYLKELVTYSYNPKIAIFKELKGKTLDELSEKEINENKDIIIDSVIDFYESISERKITNYGFLDDELIGKYKTFKEFIIERQKNTQKILKDYDLLNNIFDLIYEKYDYLINEDNSLVPIDTNMKNIMIINNNIKFIDPGELISAPKLMGYGDFTAHIYKTCLFDTLLERLVITKEDLYRLRIYAIFSSLNILAFLKKLGIDDLYNVIPYGNKYTFCELISDHLKELKLIRK